MENSVLVCGDKVEDLYICICALGHAVLLQLSDMCVLLLQGVASDFLTPPAFPHCFAVIAWLQM